MRKTTVILAGAVMAATLLAADAVDDPTTAAPPQSVFDVHIDDQRFEVQEGRPTVVSI